MSCEQSLEMMTDVLMDEQDHLRAVNKKLLEALEQINAIASSNVPFVAVAITRISYAAIAIANG